MLIVPPSAVDGAVDDVLARRWLSCVHTSVRGRPGPRPVVGGLSAPGPGWNYYSVRVELAGGRPYRILLNAASRTVAASDDGGAPPIGPLTFVDLPHPGPFLAAGFTVPTADQLGEALTAEHLAALTPAGRADVAYHRAERVGDLLFTWFD